MKVVRPLVEAELPSSNKPTTKITAVRPLKPDAPPTTLDAQLVPMLYMAVCQDTLVAPSTSGLQRFRNAAAKQLGADGAIALHGLNLGPRAGSVLARCVTNARARLSVRSPNCPGAVRVWESAEMYPSFLTVPYDAE